MSQIRWCDAGGHPFSANDPERQEFASTVEVNGQRQRLDICGPCVKKTNPFGLQTTQFVTPPTRAITDQPSIPVTPEIVLGSSDESPISVANDLAEGAYGGQENVTEGTS